MRVYVTGASGFVGSAIVKELLSAGHEVVGLVRSDEAAAKLAATGATVYRGNLDDVESVKQGVIGCDAVIHTAFNHNFANFKENCESDRRIIEALGSALAGSDRPLVITSGIGLLNGKSGVVTENDLPAVSSNVMPRVASEEATRAVAAKGVKAYIVRLPPTVHGAGDHGFVPMIIGMAKEKGESAYIDEGKNLWPAVHRFDAAVLYRLIIEQQPKQQVFHAVAEQGISFKQIAEKIGEGLHLPVVSKTGDDVAAHFTWFSHFAAMDCKASAVLTSKALGWEPNQADLLVDMVEGGYFD
ncbi:nucleoside-diphosphate-sugar epimerase [Mucilaginibacter yixingensis]|uniref:Nucleoside-diphosphate-sugar epimerase n=1 Tax=Mucilaginibacter yixingensis TaxID=1295612 RepID=A0A2T5JB93_9SPHI|nr:SDR family oxidoreductase [Mucilaginibacter yixingensis]PTQ98124.1 nucleoside-diphosphate-sugar epimerase [Mucilaginibacter yixingensis]